MLQSTTALLAVRGDADCRDRFHLLCKDGRNTYSVFVAPLSRNLHLRSCFASQGMSKEQSLASVAMYLLADKYDIPCLANFTRRSLMHSLALSSSQDWTGSPSEPLDPWQIAAHASQCNDAALLDFCMDLVVAPLRQGKSLLAPAKPKSLPPLSLALLEKINLITSCHILGGTRS